MDFVPAVIDSILNQKAIELLEEWIKGHETAIANETREEIQRIRNERADYYARQVEPERQRLAQKYEQAVKAENDWVERKFQEDVAAQDRRIEGDYHRALVRVRAINAEREAVEADRVNTINRNLEAQARTRSPYIRPIFEQPRAIIKESEQLIQKEVASPIIRRIAQVPPREEAQVMAYLGRTILSRDYLTCNSVDEQKIKNDITARYREDFNKNKWPQLSADFRQRLLSFNPNQIIEQFLSRHPWLRAETLIALQSNGVAFRFLYNLLHRLLLKTIVPAVDGRLITVEQIKAALEGQKTAISVDQDAVTREIEGYPLGRVSTDYVTDAATHYSRLGRGLVKPFEHLLTRVDVLCWLVNNYAQAMFPKSTNGITTTDIIPIHISELDKLTTEQKQWAHTFVINIADERAPCWILVSKQQKGIKQANKWTVYVPDGMEIPRENQQLAAVFNNLEVVNVNFENNAKLNDIAIMEPRVQWPVVMLERVMRWIMTAQIPANSVAEYRNNVPLSIMFESVLSQVSRYNLRVGAPAGLSAENIQRAFGLRAPFSESTVDSLLARPYINIQPLTQGVEKFAQTSLTADLLNYFDQGIFKIDIEKQQLIINNNLITPTQSLYLERALYVFFHQQVLTRLVMSPRSPIVDFGLVSRLFNHSTNLFTVLPDAPDDFLPPFIEATSCAARNRLLSIVAPQKLQDANNNINNRMRLWDETAYELLSFFLKKGNTIDKQFIAQTVQFNRTWKNQNYDHQWVERLATVDQRAFVQFAQLGIKGLTLLFALVKTNYPRNSEGPALCFTLDLAGNGYNQREQTGAYLGAFIEQLEHADSSPLFSKLALILPDNLNEQVINLLMQLITEQLEKRSKTNPAEINEIELYNLDINNPVARLFMQKLSDWSRYPQARLLVHIPHWDEAAYESEDLQRVKAEYVAIQNRVLSNRRIAASTLLEQQTETIYQQDAGSLDPNIVIQERLEEQKQPWPEAEVWYLLSNQASGVELQQNQQQQQEQQLQQQQEQQQQQEEELEPEPVIYDYTGSEAILLSRDDAEPKASRDDWQALIQKAKAICHKNNVTELFSLWVGSQENAEHVIAKIHPNAVEKMLQHAGAFRLGIAKDNLPPGFWLARIPNKPGLILCFDKEFEQRQLRERASKSPQNRNPFTVLLPTPKAAVAFSGDLRQLAYFSPDPRIQHLLWKYFSLEKEDGVRSANAKRYIDAHHENIESKDATAALQRIEAYGDFEKTTDLTSCLGFLEDWMQRTGRFSDEFAAALFGDTPTKLNEANLKSLGQLFYHYEGRPHGVEHWLFIANQLFQAFGPEHFATWKTYLLDATENFADCLEKSEVTAIALSIETLKGKEQYAEIWWNLIKAHGKSTGTMRYSQLWHAFEKVVDYIQKSEPLKFNFQAINKYLNQVDAFNGAVFLDRLLFVLKKTATQIGGRALQQKILDNVDVIDWQPSGYYYACRYEGIPYWDPDLLFTDFIRPRDIVPGASYYPHWNGFHERVDLTHALRFASQRMRFDPPQLERFNALLTHCFGDKRNYGLVLRLMVGCLALGANTLDTLNPEDARDSVEQLLMMDAQTLLFLNSTLQFDITRLNLYKFQVRLQDLPVLIAGLQARPALVAKLRGDVNIAREFINACGRALQCYQKLRKPELFDTFLDKALVANVEAPVVRVFPWLIENCPASLENLDYRSPRIRKELELFQTQLQSIDFTNSDYLPTADELIRSLDAIKFSVAPEQTRKDIVRELLRKNCLITFQDADFEKPTPDEMRDLLRRFDRYLKPNFHDENLALCKQLVENYLAIYVNGDRRQQLDDLFQIITRIDNKPHYNDLGQVLGLLIEKAKQDPPKLYSVPQLSAFLAAMVDPSIEGVRHYPINMLKPLLDERALPGFLNPNQYLLKNRTEPLPLLEFINRQIVCTPLSNQFKPVLIELAMQNQQRFVQEAHQVLAQLEMSKNLDWMQATEKLVRYLANNVLNEATRSRLLMSLTAQKPFVEPALNSLWQKTQIKLNNLLLAGEINIQDFLAYFVGPDTIKMVLVQTLKQPGDFAKHGKTLFDKLSRMTATELSKLAVYYNDDPNPTIEQLHFLLDNPLHLLSVTNLVHHYETVMQATHDQGQSKRSYSVNDNDRDSLERVLAGFKRKGKGYIADEEQKQILNLFYYTNSFAQVEQLAYIPMPNLKQVMHQALLDFKTHDGLEKEQAAARVLACMREIMVRKTGKWPHHTQMLALLYAALHNDESLLHQIKTGQGKSIITIMRAAFMALNGSIVDVFSSKVSLSKRDHDEFACVLDAMDIEHGYISPSSPVEAYKNKPSATTGYGTVNYATIGNLKLFHAAHVWQGNAVDVDQAIHVAFLDESDHELLDEGTEFNFSDNRLAQNVYNFDEWVYRTAFEYFHANRHAFKHPDPSKQIDNAIYVSNRHLQGLCETLLQRKSSSPKESDFLQKNIFPALTGDAEAIKRRDDMLRQLLTSANVASHLKDGAEFSIRHEVKQIGPGFVVQIRFAKVLINNQIQEGSTYSDLVQQFLHVRLNKEAADRGESPNFFVDPDTKIALTQNATYTLQEKDYCKLEGCTGTAGDGMDLFNYHNLYQVVHVVKLPPHEKMQTVFLPTRFCNSFDTQIDALVEQIRANNNRPILITCKDDIEVKRLFRAVSRKLRPAERVQLIEDTNEKGIQEKDIIQHAKLSGKTTFSARLGRGTDIKPDSEAGLLVLRTYPSKPRIIKQEIGRQGRNGANGACQDILDYSAIKTQYDRYGRSDFASLLLQVRAEQSEKLEKKLAKHRKNASKKFDWLDEEGKEGALLQTVQENKVQYLTTRSLEEFRRRVQSRHDRYLNNKKYLISTLSGIVMERLREVQHVPEELDHIREAWLKCRRQLEALWMSASSEIDFDERYAQFSEQAMRCWEAFTRVASNHSHVSFDVDFAKPMPDYNLEVKADSIEPTQHADAPDVIAFYQHWVASADKAFLFNESPSVPAIAVHFYGANHADMSHLYHVMGEISRDLPEQRGALLFASLARVFENNTAGFTLSCKDWTQIVSDLAELAKADDEQRFKESLVTVEKFFTQDWLKNQKMSELTPEAMAKNGRLLRLLVRITRNSQGVDSPSVETFIHGFGQAIRQHHWDHFTDAFEDDINAIFCDNPEVTKLLVAKNNYADLSLLLNLLFKNHTSTQRQERITDFTEHFKLEGAIAKYQARPAKLLPLYKIIFKGTDFNEERSRLPIPGELVGYWKDAEDRLYTFLSKRTPYKKQDLDKIINILLKIKQADRVTHDFKQRIFEKMMELPVHLPLDYIVGQVESALSLHNYADCSDRLDTLAAAGTAINEFLYLKGYLHSPTELDYGDHRFEGGRRPDGSANHPSVVDWFTSLKGMSPQDSAYFYTLGQQYFVDLRHIHKLGKAFSEKRIAIYKLKEVFECLHAIFNSPIPQRETLFNKYDAHIASVSGDAKLFNLVTMMTVLKKYPGIPETTINVLEQATQYNKLKNTVTIEKAMMLAEKLVGLEQQHGQILIGKLNELLQQSLLPSKSSDWLEQEIRYLTTFTQLLEPHQNISKHLSQALYEYHANAEELQRLFVLIGNVERLPDERRGWILDKLLQALLQKQVDITHFECIGDAMEAYAHLPITTLECVFNAFLSQQLMGEDKLRKALMLASKIENLPSDRRRSFATVMMQHIHEPSNMSVFIDKLQAHPNVLLATTDVMLTQFNAMTDAQRQQILLLASAIQALPNASVAKVQARLNQILAAYIASGNGEANVKWLSQQVDLLAERPFLSRDEVNSLDFDERSLPLLNQLRVYDALYAFEQQYPAACTIRADYYRHPNKSSNTAVSFIHFADLFSKKQHAGLNDEQVNNLWNLYRDGEIPAEHLQELVSISLKIVQYLKGNKTWNEIFSDLFTDAKQQQRLRFMQYLYHGFFDFGPAQVRFENDCYNYYQSLLPRLPKGELFSGYKPEERHYLLQQQYKSVIVLTREMENIVNHPFINQQRVNNQPVAPVNSYQTMFEDQKRCYNRFWRNSERRQQSKDLFGTLLAINVNDKESYYRSVLQALSTAQQRLLDSDKNTKRNTKGYSRLFDINVQMFLVVASDFLSDPAMLAVDKSWFKQLLQTLQTHHLRLLIDRLPKGALRDNLALSVTPMGNNALTINQENVLHALSTFNNIPKELKYLANHLRCVTTLAESTREEPMPLRLA